MDQLFSPVSQLPFVPAKQAFSTEGPCVTSLGQQHHFLKGAEPEMGHCLVSLWPLCLEQPGTHSQVTAILKANASSQPILTRCRPII